MPEQIARSVLRRCGLRFDVNATDLPGRPDIVLRQRKTAIFVHGCYWHRHTCSLGKPWPATRRIFWKRKLLANKARDRRVRRVLVQRGWRVLVIWECQTRNPTILLKRVRRLLASPRG